MQSEDRREPGRVIRNGINGFSTADEVIARQCWWPQSDGWNNVDSFYGGLPGLPQVELDDRPRVLGM